MSKANELMSQSSIKLNNFQNHSPSANPHKPDFYCPLSPSIAWGWGLKYTSCPIDASQRDFPDCSRCALQGEGTKKLVAKRKKEEKIKRRKRKEERKQEEVKYEKGKSYITP